LAVRPADIWQPHRAEQDRIRLAAGLESLRRQRVAMLQELARADRILMKGELHPVQFWRQGLEHFDRLGRDVHADAVARQHGDIERGGWDGWTHAILYTLALSRFKRRHIVAACLDDWNTLPSWCAIRTTR